MEGTTNFLKFVWKIISVLKLIIVLVIILSSCSSAKYTAEFKSQKNIDTLTILSPIVTIDYRNNKFQYYDTFIKESIHSLIEGLTFDVLSSKYKIEKKEFANFDPVLYDKICDKIEDSQKKLSGISSDSILKQIYSKFKSRYALLITFNGEINPEYPPHYNLLAGMGSGGIIIAPNTKPNSDLRLMIIDTEINEIVFYDRTNSSNYDPRVKSEIERITKTILRKIYYK